MRLPQILVLSAIAVLGVSGCGERSDQERAASAPAARKGAAQPTTAPAKADAPATATAGTPADAPAAAAQAPAPKSINTRDPIDGLPVDPAIEPIVVEVTVVHPPMTVVIGVSSAENAARVKADPQKYAAAAVNNAVARQDSDPRLPK